MPIIVGPILDADAVDLVNHPLADYRIVRLTGRFSNNSHPEMIFEKLITILDAPVDPFQTLVTDSETPTPRRKIAASRKAIFPNELLDLLISVSDMKGVLLVAFCLTERTRSKLTEALLQSPH